MAAKARMTVMTIVSVMTLISLVVAASHQHDEQQHHNHHDHDHQSADHQQPAAGKIEPSSSLSAINPRPKRHEHEAHKYVDLSHTLSNSTIHWPTNSGVNYTVQREGKNGTNLYIKSDSISMAIHSGTHLDAPIHFSEKGMSVENIPLDRLIDVPLIVVDVSSKVDANRTYNFAKADFIDQTGASLIKAKSVVLMYTGISGSYIDGADKYYGTNDTKNLSSMKIPGFSKEAAEYLVAQGVYGVGLDAPSADSSDKHHADGAFDAVAHQIFGNNNVYILENVGPNLKELINEPATLVISPLAIKTGSGSPVRLVADVCHGDGNECHAHNSATGASFSFITISMLLLGSMALLI